MSQPEPEADPAPGTLSTPEAEAAFEAEYGFRPEPDRAWPPVWQPGDFPAPEPQPTPYDLSLTDDRQATWDDPNLAGPADRTVSGRAPEPDADLGPELEL